MSPKLGTLVRSERLPKKHESSIWTLNRPSVHPRAVIESHQGYALRVQAYRRARSERQRPTQTPGTL